MNDGQSQSTDSEIPKDKGAGKPTPAPAAKKPESKSKAKSAASHKAEAAVTIAKTKEGPQECYVGFDLGGTKMLATVFDADFNEIGRKRRRTRAFAGPEQSLERIIDSVHKGLEKAERSVDDIRCIGVGCPGPLHLDKGIVLEALNLRFFNVPLKKKLEDEFHCPVYVINDVDAGVYGEYRFGAGQGAHCVLGVFPGTGVGGGCVYQGKVLRGKVSSCMEIGHVQVVPNGPLCVCGLRGCLEAVSSRLAISAAAAQAALRGQAPHLMEATGGNLAEIRSSALARSIEAGDTFVRDLVISSAEYVGVAVANFLNLLSPDVVVLGGGLVEAIPEAYVKAVAKAAKKHALPSLGSSFEVRAAALGDDSVARGASAWASHLCELS